MAGVNKIILIGNLTKDPEMKYSQQSGKAVCRFSLAVNEKWGGEDKVEYFNIVAFDRQAEIANEYLAKGKQVYIEGRIQTRKWQDQSGNDRYTTEILVSNLTMLGGKSTEGGQNRRDSNESRQADHRPPTQDDDGMPF